MPIFVAQLKFLPNDWRPKTRHTHLFRGGRRIAQQVAAPHLGAAHLVRRVRTVLLLVAAVHRLDARAVAGDALELAVWVARTVGLVRSVAAVIGAVTLLRHLDALAVAAAEVPDRAETRLAIPTNEIAKRFY